MYMRSRIHVFFCSRLVKKILYRVIVSGGRNIVVFLNFLHFLSLFEEIFQFSLYPKGRIIRLFFFFFVFFLSKFLLFFIFFYRGEKFFPLLFHKGRIIRHVFLYLFSLKYTVKSPPPTDRRFGQNSQTLASVL
jgi:hypothetical protein